MANAQQVAQAARSGPPLQHGQWTIALTGKQAGRLYPSQQALLAALFMISNKLRASQFDLAQMRAVLKNNESTSSGMRKFARAADKEYSSANLRTSCGGTSQHLQHVFMADHFYVQPLQRGPLHPLGMGRARLLLQLPPSCTHTT